MSTNIKKVIMVICTLTGYAIIAHYSNLAVMCGVILVCWSERLLQEQSDE